MDVKTMKIDPRFLREAGWEVFDGNELLVKGLLETPGGVHLITGYPGSPIAYFFDTLEALGPLLNEKGIVAKISNNEALAVAMVNGSQTLGLRSIAAMKNLGVHVAADALALGVLAGTKDDGGAVIICGDDPWSDSTQVPADSRFIAEHLRMPMVEPCCPQEVKDWIGLSFDLSKAGQIYIGYMMTVTAADGGGSVQVKPNHFPTMNSHQRRMISYENEIKDNLEQFVLLPPRTWQREQALPKRYAALNDRARELKINRIVNKPISGQMSPIGFAASGVAYTYLVHALGEMGLGERIPILKIGLSYPLDGQIVIEFASHCRQILVIEERRSFIERQILGILSPLKQSGELETQVWGKTFPNGLAGIPSTRGLHPSMLIERLGPLLRKLPDLPTEWTNGNITRELSLIEETASNQIDIPVRTPTFCPGCPHRDSSSVLLELRRDLLDPDYMATHHGRKPTDLIAHGDTGCYTMYMFEPTVPLMHNYSGMGLGGGTGGGIDPFVENKQIVFMGDSTFFHSGQTAISQSITSGQDITYIILDNKTTAMTGHQTHPGLEYDLTGNPQFALKIENMVKGMVPAELARDVRIIRMNPADRQAYRRILEETILADGVKVVIADKECGITFHRRTKRREGQVIREMGFLPEKTHMSVATEVCEYCLECTNVTGCPGLTVVDTNYGPKIQTDFSWCVNDGACHRIGACPSFEEVTIRRKQAPRFGDEHMELGDLPEPERIELKANDSWRCYITGVGGMGIGICNGILVLAGQEMGYEVQFLNKKGLAIRNGGVFSQLVFSLANASAPDDTPKTSSVTPYGKADLLLGLDLLEACRAIDPLQPIRIASKDRTVAVVNTAKTPTILGLMGREDFSCSEVEKSIRGATKQGHFFGFNVGELCERVLDSKLYVNIMMLGIVYQKGYLPLSEAAMERAIRTIIHHQIDRNLRAFQIGRKIALRPDLFVVEPTHQVESARKAFRHKINVIRSRKKGKRGKLLAKKFRVMIKQLNRSTRGLRVEDSLMREVIIRAYDCMVWGGFEYARRYCNHLVEVFHKDDPAQGYQITRAVVHNLAKVMLIKDEIYVAAMLTDSEKYKRDRRRFNVNLSQGDRISYRHYNVPEVHLFGKIYRFGPVKTRDWQLKILSKMKFLRPILFKHACESDFRDWYERELVEKLEWHGPKDYKRWLAILSIPESVTGFREIRYPKIEAARARAETLLKSDPELFELEPAPTERTVSTSRVPMPQVKRSYQRFSV